uniref:Uncharacterized protein n=1 Tax=Knipowitschia caucasica TaxID=637954 RepID=A0AAV2JD76_KNICA
MSLGVSAWDQCDTGLQKENHPHHTPSILQQTAHFTLINRLNSELQPFVKSVEPTSFSLSAAPVVFHQQSVGTERWHQQLQLAQTSRSMLDYSKLLATVKSDKGVSSAVDLCCFHSNKALEAIQAFPASEARSALENIASAVTKF